MSVNLWCTCAEVERLSHDCCSAREESLRLRHDLSSTAISAEQRFSVAELARRKVEEDKECLQAKVLPDGDVFCLRCHFSPIFSGIIVLLRPYGSTPVVFVCRLHLFLSTE